MNDQNLPQGVIEELTKRVNATLVSTPAQEGVDMYLEDRRRELAETTLLGYSKSLDYFIEYCDLNEIENLNDLTGRDLRDYRKWRREDSTDSVDSLSKKTERDEQYLLQNFLKYLESVDAVTEGLHEKVVVPPLGPSEGVRDETLSKDRVADILDYLERYHYATIEHVTWVILCASGGRLGGAHSLDVDDCHLDTADPYLSFRHRPEEDTRLKNELEGERDISISREVGELLKAYLHDRRPDVTDDHGREPLLASTHGRIAKSTMRRYVYKWTRPCEVSSGCPHDKNIAKCPAVENADVASKCPSTRSPHSIRRSYITEELDAGIPKHVLSDRCDVSPEVLDRHYDKRDEEQKRRLRKEIMQEVHSDSGGSYLGSTGGNDR